MTSSSCLRYVAETRARLPSRTCERACCDELRAMVSIELSDELVSAGAVAWMSLGLQ